MRTCCPDAQSDHVPLVLELRCRFVAPVLGTGLRPRPEAQEEHRVFLEGAKVLPKGATEARRSWITPRMWELTPARQQSGRVGQTHQPSCPT